VITVKQSAIEKDDPVWLLNQYRSAEIHGASINPATHNRKPDPLSATTAPPAHSNDTTRKQSKQR
jgi:hypothetical protein